MAKVKLGLAKKKLSEKLTLCQSFETNMAANAATTTPAPPLATLTAKRTGINAKLLARDQLKVQLDAANAELEVEETELTELLRQEGAYIQEATGGDADKILSTGAQVAATPSPRPAAPAVQGLEALANGNEGEARFKWPSAGARLHYELQLTLDPNLPASWEYAGSTKKLRLDAKDQQSGKKLWGRVRAVGPQGPGPWSDPACVMVP